MPVTEAVALVHSLRRDDDVVVTSMGNAREWMALGPLHERDLVLVPSAMGHATCIGLGLALAQPNRRIIVLTGDGSLLMNLGTLVTISAEMPANLIVVVYDNGVYEVTGAQPTAGSPGGRINGDAVDFPAITRGCGWKSVFHWSALDDWRRGINEVLAAKGPTLVVLDVEPALGRPGPKSPGPGAERAQRFIAALRAK
jgi:thiamine pyrophosphate-dependent acetolactate synthase large subunit-like protein